MKKIVEEMSLSYVSEKDLVKEINLQKKEGWTQLGDIYSSTLESAGGQQFQGYSVLMVKIIEE